VNKKEKQKQRPVKEKKNHLTLNKIFHDDKYMRILSVFIAIIIWGVVVTLISTEAESTVDSVPITMEQSQAVLSNMGLSVIEMETTTATLTVEGERLAVGSLTSDDFIVVVQTESVNGPGLYSLPLTAYKRSADDRYQIIEGSLSPNSVEVKLDLVVDQKMNIEIELEEMAVADGYIAQDAYCTPAQVTLSGPEEALSQVVRVAVKHVFNEEVDEASRFTEQILLYDKNGEIIEDDHITLSDSHAEIMVPVLKSKTVPLEISFLNVPEGFPLEQLEYVLSAQEIGIAGPPDEVDNITAINVGYINFKQMTPSSVYAFEVPLPVDFVNLDNVTSVTVNIDMADMALQYFYNITNFDIINVPANFEVENSLDALSSVRIVGDIDLLGALTADDIVVQVDLSDRNLKKGQFSVPVRVLIPDRGLVWAVGDYTTVVTVTEKTER